MSEIKDVHCKPRMHALVNLFFEYGHHVVWHCCHFVIIIGRMHPYSMPLVKCMLALLMGCQSSTINTGFVRVLENLESPGILLWHFPGLESPGKKPLVLESPGNQLNSTKNMKFMEGSEEN